MDNKDIIYALVNKFHYSDNGAKLVLEKILAARDDIKIAFEHYLTNQEIPDLSVGHTSVQDLMDDYDMNPIAALLTMDWLIREPETARAMLKKGFDRPVFSA